MTLGEGSTGFGVNTNISVSCYHEDKRTPFEGFIDVDKGYNTPQTINVTVNEKINIKVVDKTPVGHLD